MNYCRNCGNQMEPDAHYCPRCGMPDYGSLYGKTPKKSVFERLVKGLSRLSGGDGKVRFRLGDLFGEVFRKHPKEEADEILIGGTASTTPKTRELDTVRPRPWLYSRVLAMFGIAFLILGMGYLFFSGELVLPGVAFLGATAVPAALLIFFFEINLPKNISFFTVIKIFLIGGCASIAVSLFLYLFVPMGEEIGYLDAVLIGLVEEAGKLAVILFFLHWEKKADWRLNALLVGAAVGAGFAAFESAGYIVVYALEEGPWAMLEVTVLRAILAPGGHVAWAAITGYALMYAKGDAPLSFSVFSSKKFWGLFWIPILLHALWDMPIPFSTVFLWMPILLTVLSWVLLLALINAGIGQVIDRVRRAQSGEEEALPRMPYGIPWSAGGAWYRAPGTLYNTPPNGFFPLFGPQWQNRYR